MSENTLTSDLEQLHSNTGKHELQQSGDDHDVADCSDGHKHTLHHVLLEQRDKDGQVHGEAAGDFVYVHSSTGPRL